MLNNVDTNYNFKQIFLVFLFNIRKYSPKVMNIILPRLNNFDIKQKRRGMLVLLYATNTKKIWLTKHNKFWSKHKFFL